MACVLVAAIAVIVATEPAHAQDNWTGADKAQHVIGSAVIGTVSGVALNDKWTAFAVSMVPGVLKEVYDAKHPDKHTASVKDLAANAVGAAIGVYMGNCVIRERSITCHMEF
jgi:uncharacterized protein YfiM (DUF2279 family)